MNDEDRRSIIIVFGFGFGLRAAMSRTGIDNDGFGASLKMEDDRVAGMQLPRRQMLALARTLPL